MLAVVITLSCSTFYELRRSPFRTNKMVSVNCIALHCKKKETFRNFSRRLRIITNAYNASLLSQRIHTENVN